MTFMDVQLVCPYRLLSGGLEFCKPVTPDDDIYTCEKGNCPYWLLNKHMREENS